MDQPSKATNFYIIIIFLKKKRLTLFFCLNNLSINASWQDSRIL